MTSLRPGAECFNGDDGAEWGIVNKTWDRGCFRLFMAFLKK